MFNRSMKLVYLKNNKIDNIETFDFHLPEDVFYNSTLNPENEGFCTNDCLGNGVQNISKCTGSNSFNRFS